MWSERDSFSYHWVVCQLSTAVWYGENPWTELSWVVLCFCLLPPRRNSVIFCLIENWTINKNNLNISASFSLKMRAILSLTIPNLLLVLKKFSKICLCTPGNSNWATLVYMYDQNGVRRERWTFWFWGGLSLMIKVIGMQGGASMRPVGWSANRSNRIFCIVVSSCTALRYY